MGDRASLLVTEFFELVARNLLVYTLAEHGLSIVLRQISVAAAPLLLRLPLILVDLLADLYRNWQSKLCGEAEVGTERDREIFRTIVRVVNVPLELVTEQDVADPDVEADRADEFSLHLAVLPELVNLFLDL